MTTTAFYLPKTITQRNIPNLVTGKDSIPWQSNSVSNMSNTGLYTISGFWQEKFRSQTSELWCTGFEFPEFMGTVTGIELELDIRRAARIEDLVIQLTLNGELIGDNMASQINPVQADMYTADNTPKPIPFDDYHVYGAADNLWGAELTSVDVLDPSFGIVISFQSNLIIPHRDIAYLDQVALRITYA